MEQHEPRIKYYIHDVLLFLSLLPIVASSEAVPFYRRLWILLLGPHIE